MYPKVENSLTSFSSIQLTPPPSAMSTENHNGSHVIKIATKQFKTPSEVVAVLLETGVNKSKMDIDQLIILGFLSGGM